VQQAVVVVREDVPGDQRLVAYLVPQARQSVPVEEVRRVLAEHLPAYMVPATFVPLDVLPLTPNGKVDRRALPAPDWSGLARGSAAPRTPIEELLAGIWAEVLKVERVGVHDNFFALGGHSLLAIQVCARLRQALQIEVPPRTLFEAPTLAELAAVVSELQARGASRHVPLIRPVSLEAYRVRRPAQS
jgi:acyl carrier protein